MITIAGAEAVSRPSAVYHVSSLSLFCNAQSQCMKPAVLAKMYAEVAQSIVSSDSLHLIVVFVLSVQIVV